MPLLSPSDQQKLRDAFSEMTRPVRALFFTQSLDCDTCVLTRQILAELPALTDKFTVEELNVVLDKERAAQYGIDRAPSIAIVWQDEASVQHDSRVRFVGAPSGYEFISLVQALLLAGGRPSSLSGANLARLAAVDKPVVMQVFTTPT